MASKRIRGDHVPPLADAADDEPRTLVPADAAAEASPPPDADPAAPARGLECPRCGCQHLEVLYTRPLWGDRIQRRRQCRYCGRRISTVEQRV